MERRGKGEEEGRERRRGEDRKDVGTVKKGEKSSMSKFIRMIAP